MPSYQDLLESYQIGNDTYTVKQQDLSIRYSFDTSNQFYSSITGTLAPTDLEFAFETALDLFSNYLFGFTRTEDDIAPELVITQADITASGVHASGPTYSVIDSNYVDLGNADIYIDDDFYNSNYNNYEVGTFAYETVLHELAHHLGLGHPNDNPTDSAYDWNSTIMSYNQTSYIPISLMYYDLQALSDLYGGLNSTYKDGDTTYNFDGSKSSDGIDHTGALTGSYTKIAETIWDADGNDTIDTSSYTSGGVNIALTEGTGSANATSVGDTIFWLADGANIENAIGTNSADNIYGNHLNNVLEGNGGDDYFISGGGVHDTMIGGAGADDYVISSDTLNATIEDTSADINTLKFQGVDLSDPVEAIRSGDDLLLSFIDDNNDERSVLIKDAYDVNDNLDLSVENITLDDGTFDIDLFLSQTGLEFDVTGESSHWGDTQSETISFTDVVHTGAFAFLNDGDDQVQGSSGDDYFSGGAGNDIIYGNDGNDYLVTGLNGGSAYGGNGNDRIKGSNDSDSLNGGEGNDTIYSYDGNDSLSAGEGYDKLYAGDGNDSLTAGFGGGIFDGGAGIDKLTFSDNLTAGGVGVNSDTGIAYYFGYSTEVFDLGNIENFTLTDYSDIFYGDGGNNEVISDDGYDVVYGYGGDDIIAGQGSGEFYGGDGNDKITFTGEENIVHIEGGNGDDQISVYNSFANLMGGSGIDELSLFSFSNYDITLNTVSGIAYFEGGIGYIEFNSFEEIKTSLGDDKIIGSSTDETFNSSNGDDEIYGKGGDDFINSGNGDDYISGGSGNDTLIGSDGNDYIIGGSGDDTISGGADNDYLVYNLSNNYLSSDYYNADNGYDILRLEFTSSEFTSAVEAEVLDLQSRIDTYGSGSKNFTEFGLGVANVEEIDLYINGDYTSITALAQDDYGDVEQGVTYNGNVLSDNGNGSDTALSGVTATSGTFTTTFGISITLNSNGTFAYVAPTTQTGVDSFSYTITDGNSNTDTATFEINVQSRFDGTSSADTTTLDNDANLFYGYAGNDGWINGLNGNDTIYGGDGNDFLRGGNGDDIIYGDADNDTMIGDAGSDSLYGGTGDDTLSGTVGNDLLDGGDGTDWVRYDTGAFTLTSGITADLNVGTVTKSDSSIDTLVSIERLNGSNYDDILYASDNGEDRLYGKDGNDILIGGTDRDWLYGDDGDDYIDGRGGLDIIYGGDGNDTIYGGSESDDMYGQNGNDTLYGLGGDDDFNGSSGNDTFNGGDGVNIAKYSLMGGAITVDLTQADNQVTKHDSSTDTLNDIDQIYGTDYNDVMTGGSSIYNVLFKGFDGNDTLTGWNGADYLYGDDGNDTLDGKGYNDRLYGGAGDDLFIYESTSTTTTGGSGYDTVVDDDDAGDTDTLRITGGIDHDNLWFEQVGNDLVITINGTSQQIELENWYVSGQGGQIEAIETSNDNMTLSSADFQAFVDQMSTLTSPSSGTQDYDSASQTALADELMLWSSI